MKSNLRAFVLAGVLLAAALAIFVGPYASSSPDGLEKVAAEEGFAGAADDSAVAEGPLADYGVQGIDDERTGTAAAGLVGVLVTFGIGIGVFALVRTMRSSDDVSASDPAATEA